MCPLVMAINLLIDYIVIVVTSVLVKQKRCCEMILCLFSFSRCYCSITLKTTIDEAETISFTFIFIHNIICSNMNILFSIKTNNNRQAISAALNLIGLSNRIRFLNFNIISSHTFTRDLFCGISKSIICEILFVTSHLMMCYNYVDVLLQNNNLLQILLYLMSCNVIFI